MKKIVTFSDTHSLHNKMNHVLPEGDILLFAGDMCNRGTLSEVEDFGEYLKQIDYRYSSIVVIAGNHDFALQDQKQAALNYLLKSSKVTYLENEKIIINGIKIWGSPITPTFCSWAFMCDRGEPIKKYWDMIPNDTDILITHGPSYGINDFAEYGQMHVGCEELKIKVDQIKPLMHLAGHLHESYNVQESNGTFHVNTSICDLKYRPFRKPYEFELNEVTKKLTKL